MPELSNHLKNLIERYKKSFQEKASKTQEPTLHVDEVALKVAAFYEYLRTIVEWKEEHLMKKAAISRKLKTKFLELELNDFSNIENAAESLILDLIRGGYFPNDKIPESKISQVKDVLERYIFILKENQDRLKGKMSLSFYNWLIEILACEIEEILSPPVKEKALIDFMFYSIKDKIKISKQSYLPYPLKKEDIDQQLYIAVCQALFKLDEPIISYYLLKIRYPSWQSLNKEQLFEISKEIPQFKQQIEKNLKHPLTTKFYTICEKYDTPYLLLGDILSMKKPEELVKEISEPTNLEKMIKSVYLKRLAVLRSKINRAAIYSTISIFITKILFLLILEIAIERAIGGQINPIFLAGDILIPTFLMFIITSTVRTPSPKNLNIVIIETMKIAYQNTNPEIYEVKIVKPRDPFIAAVLSLLYVICTFVSIGIIYYFLNSLGFSLLSIIIDIVFIALILFTGTVVSKRAQELTMEEQKENFLTFLADMFFLPIQGLGRWLSNTWKKYNAIALFFTILIDTQFSAFVEFLEKWRDFIKERKEEIR